MNGSDIVIDKETCIHCTDIVIFDWPIDITLAIFIGSWLAHFSFYLPENLDGGETILVEGLHDLTQQPKFSPVVISYRQPTI